MLTSPLKHQTMAADKLSKLRCGALFGEMGIGKSRIFYEVAERKINAGKAARLVVLCPVSGKAHLADEALKHTGHDPVIHEGDYSQEVGRINIIGIESQSTSIRAINKLTAMSDGAVVVIDESSLIKNRDAKRTKHITDATKAASYRYISDGLAMPNGVEDLWSQMWWLSPLILGYPNYSEFARYHLDTGGGIDGKGVTRRYNTDLIAAKVAPYAFEIKKSDCLDLPSKTYSYRTTQLSARGRALYDEAKRRLLLEKAPWEITSETIYKLFTALQMISSGVVPKWIFEEDEEIPEIDNPKLGLLRSAVEEIGQGKVVVWCKYIQEAEAAHAVLDGLKAVRVDGSVPSRERKRRLASFKDKEGAQVLISTLQMGARVNDWGFADYAIYLSNSFDYAIRAQSEDRTHRAMMTGKAHYIDLRVDTGIEKKICRSLDRKENALRAFQDKIRELRSEGTQKAAQAITEAVGEL